MGRKVTYWNGPAAGSRAELGDLLERPRPGSRPEPAKGGQDGVLSGADGLLHVQGQQQMAVELVGAADELARLALEGVRRRLEVAGVHVDDVGDGVHEQAHRLAVQPD